MEEKSQNYSKARIKPLWTGKMMSLMYQKEINSNTSVTNVKNFWACWKVNGYSKSLWKSNITLTLKISKFFNSSHHLYGSDRSLIVPLSLGDGQTLVKHRSKVVEGWASILRVCWTDLFLRTPKNWKESHNTHTKTYGLYPKYWLSQRNHEAYKPSKRAGKDRIPAEL